MRLSTTTSGAASQRQPRTSLATSGTAYIFVRPLGSARSVGSCVVALALAQCHRIRRGNVGQRPRHRVHLLENRRWKTGVYECSHGSSRTMNLVADARNIRTIVASLFRLSRVSIGRSNQGGVSLEAGISPPRRELGVHAPCLMLRV